MKKLVLTSIFLLLPSLVSAGGSWEKVSIETFTIFSNTDYELVVIPERQSNDYKDPYMGNCSRFTVKGTYAWLYAWRFPDDVNRENHKSALAYLQQALIRNEGILFGWLGTGFVPIDPDNECVVRSRALELITQGEDTAVISYHDPI